MMNDLNIQLCPETRICSIIKKDGKKIDLMPFEVDQVKNAAGNLETIKDVLNEIDPDFVNELDSEEIGQVSKELGE